MCICVYIYTRMQFFGVFFGFFMGPVLEPRIGTISGFGLAQETVPGSVGSIQIHVCRVDSFFFETWASIRC